MRTKVGPLFLLALVLIGGALLLNRVSAPALPPDEAQQGDGSHVFTPDATFTAALVAKAGQSRAVREGSLGNWSVDRAHVKVVFAAELGLKRVAEVEVPYTQDTRTEVWHEQYQGRNGASVGEMLLTDGRPWEGWSWFSYPMADETHGLTVLLPRGVTSVPAWAQRDVSADGNEIRRPVESRRLAAGAVEFGPSRLPIGFGPVTAGDQRHEPTGDLGTIRNEDLPILAAGGRGCEQDAWSQGRNTRRYFAVEDTARVAGDPLGQRLLWCGADGTVLVARTAAGGGAVLVVVDGRDLVVASALAPATTAADVRFAWRHDGVVTVLGPQDAATVEVSGPEVSRRVPITPAGLELKDPWIVLVSFFDAKGLPLGVTPVDDEAATDFS